MAQLVARYLGVVEAASSSLVTQTRKTGDEKSPVFPLLSSFFRTFRVRIFLFFARKNVPENTLKMKLVHNLVHTADVGMHIDLR